MAIKKECIHESLRNRRGIRNKGQEKAVNCKGVGGGKMEAPGNSELW